jgi:hypothetical protein
MAAIVMSVNLYFALNFASTLSRPAQIVFALYGVFYVSCALPAPSTAALDSSPR